MAKQIIDLNGFAEGAVAERLNNEIQKVLENIQDPNTDAKKARKVVLSLTIKPDENRRTASVSVSAKTTVAPAKEVSSSIIMDYDADGKVTGAELKSKIPGQTYIDNDGDVADDTGNKITDIEQKPSNLRRFK